MPKSNNADAFKMHRNMMRLSGVWPEERPNFLYKIRTVASWILGVTLTVSMAIEVIKDITDFTKLSEILYIMTTMTIYVIKLGAFTYQRKTFLGMVDFLKHSVFLSYPDDLDHYMAKTIKISTLIANLYRYLCLCCAGMIAVYPVLDNKPLPFPFPWDLGKYRYFMYVFQVVAISFSAWNNSCMDTLTTSLMGIGAAQLDILREKIVRIDDDVEKEKYGRDKEIHVMITLRQCVEHYSAIIKFIETIDEVFTVGLLAQFLGSITVICNTLFHFVLISATSLQFFTLTNYFVAMVTQLSMYCWYGNEIMLKSIFVGEACYVFNWFDYGQDVGKYVFIIMERSKRPLSITALKFSKLSLTSLTSILQWSYSYLTLLLNMYSKQSSAH